MNAIAVFPQNGCVCFFQENGKKKTRVMFCLENFQKNCIHAIHIHEYGDMTDGCNSLGKHFNPSNEKHGKHAGDLIKNFQADEHGQFHYSYIDDQFSVNEILGRSVVIHEYPDDLGDSSIYLSLSNKDLTHLCIERGYKNVKTKKQKLDKLVSESEISGNAGKRLLCSIIGRTARNQVIS